MFLQHLRTAAGENKTFPLIKRVTSLIIHNRYGPKANHINNRESVVSGEINMKWFSILLYKETAKMTVLFDSIRGGKG